MNLLKSIKKIILMIVILGISFLLSLIMSQEQGMNLLIPALFTLAVFLVSLVIDGYIYGIISSLISVLMINFAFTFPYFEFNFSIPENIISAFILLVITISTTTLTTKLRMQEKIKVETEKEKMRANLLRAVSHDLRTPLTTIVGSSSTIVEKYTSL